MPRDEPRDPPAPSAVAAALEAGFDWTVTDVEPFQAGLNAVSRVERTDEEPVVAKLATFVTDAELHTEARLHARLAADSDARLPGVVGTLATTEPGVACLVTEYVPGHHETDLRAFSRGQQRQLLAESGRLLAQVHAVSVTDGFGPLERPEGGSTTDRPREFDGDQTPEFTADPSLDWSEWFRRLCQQMRAGLTGVGATTDANPRFGDLADRITSTLAGPVEPATQPAVLIGDFRPANLVFGEPPAADADDGDRLIRALVDIGAGPTADGLLDLALAEDALVGIPFGGTEHGEEYRRVLRRAYCDESGLDPTVVRERRYTRYRLYARGRRMAAFDYWQQFAHETNSAATAERWRRHVRRLCRRLDG